jgi:hypothetical protein
MYYEFEYDEDNNYIRSINIIQKTENSLFSFEIKTIENEKIIHKIKLFTDKIKNGDNDMTLDIIYDKFNKQCICYNNSEYNFITDFFGQTSGYYTSIFTSNLNLVNMFEDLIRDYEEKKITGKYIIEQDKEKKITGKYIIEQDKEKKITGKYIIEQDKEKDYQNYLNNFGSYKL